MMDGKDPKRVGRRGHWLPPVLAALALLPVLLLLWIITSSGIATVGWFWIATLIGVAPLLAPSVLMRPFRNRQQQ